MHDSVTYKIVPVDVMSGDTESESEIEHLQVSPIRTANFFRPREERETYKKGKKEEVKDENEKRIDFKVTLRKISMESPKEYNVLPQDQEYRGSSQDYKPRPRPQNDLDLHMIITVKPEYPATQRVKKMIEFE